MSQQQQKTTSYSTQSQVMRDTVASMISDQAAQLRAQQAQEQAEVQAHHDTLVELSYVPPIVCSVRLATAPTHSV